MFSVYHSFNVVPTPPPPPSTLSCSDFICTRKWVADEKGPKFSNGDPHFVIDQKTGQKNWKLSPNKIRISGCLISTFCLIPTVGMSLTFALGRIARLGSCYHLWCCINTTKKEWTFARDISKVAMPSVDVPQRSGSPLTQASWTVVPHVGEGEEELDLDDPRWDDPEQVVIVQAILQTVDLKMAQAQQTVVPGQAQLKTVEQNEIAPRWISQKKDVPRTICDRLKDITFDLLKLPATPLICVAMEVSACFTCCAPYNGRKLYQSCEAFQYDGKWQMSLFAKVDGLGAIPDCERFAPPQSFMS